MYGGARGEAQPLARPEANSPQWRPIAAAPCGFLLHCHVAGVSTMFICLTLAGLLSLLPSVASIAFTPVIPGRLVTSLTAMVPTMNRVMASLPTSSYQPLSSVLPLSKAAPDIFVPGWTSVPPRMLKKIWNLEFVDMRELLPESWRVEPNSEGCC